MTSPERLLRTLDRKRFDRTPVVVCGAGVNGLAYARSLGRRGVPVIALDVSIQPAFHSRYALCAAAPHPDHAPDHCLAFLADLADRLGEGPVLVATSDLFQSFIAARFDWLRERFRVLSPAPATITDILDKRRQYERAREAGVLLPETCFPGSADELEQAVRRVSYPCILKPYQAHVGRKLIGGRKVLAADTPDQLREAYAGIGYDAPFMIQEIIPGGDDALVGYLGLWSEGRELAWMTKRKLRQSPPRFGDGSFQVSERLDEAADISRRLLDAFRYGGLVGVEFKRDPRDQRYKLMEINPRTVSCTQLAVTSGVDFPWLGYRLLTEGPDALPESTFQEGVEYVHETWDVQSYLALRRSGELRFGPWWRSWRRARARALGAWDDPLPLIRTVAGAWRKTLSRSR